MNAIRRTTSPWDRIDAAPVINLDSRPERWEHFKKSAKGIIPDEKLIRFSASMGVDIPGYGIPPWFRGKTTDSRWAARAGCTLSHQRTTTLAKENEWNTILILEDDADFSATNRNELSKTLDELLSDQFSWDVCYLGFSKTKGPSRHIGRIGNHDVFEVSGCSATHAYLLNSKARDWIIEKLPAVDRIWPWIALHRVIDRWYSWNMSLDLKIIAVSPSIITQSEGYSDLVENLTDYNLEFPGKVVRSSNSSLAFYCARMYWRIRGMTTLGHDLFRYLIKMKKGF